MAVLIISFQDQAKVVNLILCSIHGCIGECQEAEEFLILKCYCNRVVCLTILPGLIKGFTTVGSKNYLSIYEI
jgi:hypothetical protein